MLQAILQPNTRWHSRIIIAVNQLFHPMFYQKHVEIHPYGHLLLEANTKNAQTWFYKGEALTHLSQFKEAVYRYEEAPKIDPTNKETQEAKQLALEAQRPNEISLLIEEGLGSIEVDEYQNAITNFI